MCLHEFNGVIRLFSGYAHHPRSEHRQYVGDKIFLQLQDVRKFVVRVCESVIVMNECERAHAVLAAVTCESDCCKEV